MNIDNNTVVLWHKNVQDKCTNIEWKFVEDIYPRVRESYCKLSNNCKCSFRNCPKNK